MNKIELTQNIKQKAKELGADLVGIASADFNEQQYTQLKNYVKEGRHGNLKYMEDYKLRSNPKNIVKNANSIIVIALNYYQEKPTIKKDEGIIARYAYGRDYHKTIKNILKKLLKYIEEKAPGEHHKIAVDTVPILEKYYAQQAGIGFIGKNTTIITKSYGSFILLGEIITTLKLKTDKPATGTCGTCTRCLEACPTKALKSPYIMDAKKCISYQTIENKEKIPPEIAKKIKNRLFGCDICQEVCPYNKAFAKQTKNKDFNKKIAGHTINLTKLKQLTEEEFIKTYAGSPIMRPKLKKLQQTAKTIQENQPNP